MLCLWWKCSTSCWRRRITDWNGKWGKFKFRVMYLGSHWDWDDICWQVVIYLNLPPNGKEFLYHLTVGNRNHRARFGKSDTIYGSDYIVLEIKKDVMKKIQYESTTNTSYSRLRLERTHWKTLSTDKKRCDESMTTSNANTTQCIIKHVEDSFGCSMGISGSSSDIERWSIILGLRSSIYTKQVE